MFQLDYKNTENVEKDFSKLIEIFVLIKCVFDL